jgi:predicted dehydrogenase
VKSIAIAGLGAAAKRIHLPAYSGLADLQVVGGCDPDARSGSFPFRVFGTVAEMLQTTRPDILAVATPPGSHFALVKEGLEAGCHVFCEKPFTGSLQDARTLCALARDARRWIVVNTQYRFMRIHQEAKRRIGTPEFGRLLFVSAQQTFFVTEETEAGWRGRDVERTCKEFGPHVFDLCRFFFDEDPHALTARMQREQDGEAADRLNLIQLEFSGDRTAQIVLDRLSRGPHRYLDLRLDGSAGCIETHLGGGISLSVGIRGGSRRPFASVDASMGGWARLYQGERYRKIAADPLDVFAEATRRLLRSFLDALDSGAVPPCHADDSLRTLALVRAAYESDSGRARVEMEYP